jgi:hypothetical protein
MIEDTVIIIEGDEIIQNENEYTLCDYICCIIQFFIIFGLIFILFYLIYFLFRMIENMSFKIIYD